MFVNYLDSLKEERRKIRLKAKKKAREKPI